MLDQDTSFTLQPRPISCRGFSSVELTSFTNSIQSAVFCACLETAPEASAICHGKVPNQIQASQAIKSVRLNKNLKQRIKMWLTGHAVPNPQTSQEFT